MGLTNETIKERVLGKGVKMSHTLYLLGDMAVCPLCSGSVKRYIMALGVRYACNDCGGIFRPKDLGHGDKEIVCDLIETKPLSEVAKIS